MTSRRVLLMLLVVMLGLPAVSVAQTAPSAAKTAIGVNEAGLPSLAMEIDGKQFAGFALVGGLNVKRPLVEALCGADGICTGDLHLAIDDLDVAAAGLTDKTKHDTVKNSIGNIRALAAELDGTLGVPDLDSDDDGLLDRVYGPGDAHYGNITLKRGFVGDRTLSDWFKAASQGGNARKSISVIAYGRDGKETARYNLFDCFPVRWGISYEDGLIEKIEIAVEKIERARITVNEEGVRKAPVTALLEADGEKLGSFELASGLGGAISWGDNDCDDTAERCTPDGVDDDCDGIASCAAPDGVDDDCDGIASCTAPAMAALDRLEEEVAGLADRARHDIAMNAIRNMKARMAEVETGLAGARRPGRTKYGNMTLKRGIAGTPEAAQWITETAEGKPWKRSMTLILQGQDGKEIARFTMQGGPVRYRVAAGDEGHLVEEITFVVERLELK